MIAILDPAYIVKFLFLFPLIAGIIYFLLIFGADHTLFRIVLEPFVDFPFSRKHRLLDYDINKIFCTGIMTAGTYFTINPLLRSFFSIMPNYLDVNLISIFIAVGIFYGIRVTSVFVSGTLARSFGFAFVTPMFLYGVFVILFPEALANIIFSMEELLFVVIAVIINYFVFETGIYFFSRSWWRLERKPDDIIASLPLLGTTIIGRDRMYLRLAEIIGRSRNICGVAGTFAFYPRKRYDLEYGKEFNEALKRYRDSFFEGDEDSGIRRSINIRYIGAVDNDTDDKYLKMLPETNPEKENYDKFDDVIGRCKYARVHHTNLRKEDPRLLIGDCRLLSIERPVRAVPRECCVSYYFDNFLVAGMSLSIFETMWKNTIHVIERAEQLRQNQDETGVTNERFIELVEACIDCVQFDLSNENNPKNIMKELSTKISIQENEFEQFFHIIVKPQNEESCKEFIQTLGGKFRLLTSIEINDQSHLVIKWRN